MVSINLLIFVKLKICLNILYFYMSFVCCLAKKHCFLLVFSQKIHIEKILFEIFIDKLRNINQYSKNVLFFINIFLYQSGGP